MSRKPYMRKLPTWWWLSQRRYTIYMIRELTCIFIGAYAVLIVIGLLRLSHGRAEYDAFLDALQCPFGMVFHLLALLFALFHTVTWFGVTPKAMPLWLGERRVPDAAIIMAHYAGWIVVSAAVVFLARVQ
jgi:fumarate reductase subunit C